MVDIVNILPVLYYQEDKESPTLYEILSYVDQTIKHSGRVHFYLKKLGVEISDGEVPHDLAGEGNKLEWEVLRGLALRNRDTEEKIRRFEESLQRHRMQRHHRMWNDKNSEATETDFKYGAIDSVVCLLEDRGYQGGCHTFEQIEELIPKNPEYKQPWLEWALKEIRRINEKFR